MSFAALVTLGFVCPRAPPPAHFGGSTHAPGAVQRHRRLSMIEAYDLVPMLTCFSASSSAIEVEQCMQSISPWFSISDEGKVFLSEAAAGGFVGGSVGVIGTVISTLYKRDEVKDRLKCPYCNGSGQILCGVCFGTGMESINIAGTDEWQEVVCSTCEGAGTVVCINCQGSGLAVPEDILQKLGDSEAGFTEEDYIGLFDEVKFPTLLNQRDDTAAYGEEASAREESVVAAGEPDKPEARKVARESREQAPRPNDYTGGLG